MNVLFLTIGQMESLQNSGVHIDVVNALKNNGHNVTVVATSEKKLQQKTKLREENGVKVLTFKTGNLTKCSIIEKGITTLRIEKQFIKNIKKYFDKEEFDLVIYNTPPITLAKAVKYCKKKYNAKSYLMLKDIFPQNAIDIGIMSKSGLKGVMYKMFRKKEIQLYQNSDRIGCMSNKNKEYILEHNPYINEEIVEIFPNSLIIEEPAEKNREVLTKYNIDEKKTTFIYGGNLGLPQGLDFLLKGIKSCSDFDCNFVIVGAGAKKEIVEKGVEDIANAHYINHLPKNEYETLCNSCDIGIVSLDYRFTIPNYPSRTLSYMKNCMPIFALTDRNTDIKELVEDEAKCGKWVYSDDLDCFTETVKWFIENKNKLSELGDNGRKYFEEHFNVEICVKKLEDFYNS